MRRRERVKARDEGHLNSARWTGGGNTANPTRASHGYVAGISNNSVELAATFPSQAWSCLGGHSGYHVTSIVEVFPGGGGGEALSSKLSLALTD